MEIVQKIYLAGLAGLVDCTLYAVLRTCIAPQLAGARLEKMRSSRDEIIFPAECTLWNSTVTPVEKGDCTLNRLSRADPNRGEAKFQFRPLNELRFRNRFRAAIRQLLFRRRTRKSCARFLIARFPYLRFFTSNGHLERTLLLRACHFK